MEENHATLDRLEPLQILTGSAQSHGSFYATKATSSNPWSGVFSCAHMFLTLSKTRRSICSRLMTITQHVPGILITAIRSCHSSIRPNLMRF